MKLPLEILRRGAGDNEPSLASPVGGQSQICWCAGCDDDREHAPQVAAYDKALDVTLPIETQPLDTCWGVT